jgi:DUF971 family protein
VSSSIQSDKQVEDATITTAERRGTLTESELKLNSVPALFPTSLQRQGSGLLIGWSDGSCKMYTVAALRNACPCATCREKKSASVEPTPSAKGIKGGLLPVISMQEARPLGIEHMRPVGNYAYNISFSDGHDSGIYTFEQLLELGETCAQP